MPYATLCRSQYDWEPGTCTTLWRTDCGLSLPDPKDAIAFLGRFGRFRRDLGRGARLSLLGLFLHPGVIHLFVALQRLDFSFAFVGGLANDTLVDVPELRPTAVKTVLLATAPLPGHYIRLFFHPHLPHPVTPSRHQPHPQP